MSLPRVCVRCGKHFGVSRRNQENCDPCEPYIVLDKNGMQFGGLSDTYREAWDVLAAARVALVEGATITRFGKQVWS